MGTRNFSRRFLTAALVLILLPTLITAAAADPVHGSVAFVEVKYGNFSTYQASAVEVSPDGNFLYLGTIGGAITVFKRDVNTGSLLLVEHIQDDDFGASGELYGIGDIVISPDGNHLYTCADLANTIIIFSRNTSSGALSYKVR